MNELWELHNRKGHAETTSQDLVVTEGINNVKGHSQFATFKGLHTYA